MTDEEKETGVSPVAQDGEPNDDLAKARARRTGRARRAARAEGGSVSERAESAEPPSDDDGELFPLGSLDGDPRVTLKTLMKTGLPVEVTASLMSAEVPTLGGLIDPNGEGKAIVTFEVAHYVPVPVRKDVGGERRIVGWKLRQVLRPTHVAPADSVAADAAAS